MASESLEIDTNTALLAKCYLLQLPPELRNMIYQLTIIFDKSIEVSTRHDIDEVGSRDKEDLWTVFDVPVAPFLQTCRQIRGETTVLYCSSNTFNFCLVSWLFGFSTNLYINEFGALADKLHLLQRFQVTVEKGVFAMKLTSTPTVSFTLAQHSDAFHCRFCERGIEHSSRRSASFCPVKRHAGTIAKVQEKLDKAKATRGLAAGLNVAELKETLNWLS